MRAEWQNLNGLWNYGITPEESDSFTPAGEILVPFAIESSLSGVGTSVGEENALWYERVFTVPKSWKGRNVLLHFGAVDWKSEIWVNDVKVCEHTGGYTPFTIDVTSSLKQSGKQTLRVKVWDATDNSYQPRGKQVLQPSGIWYTPVFDIASGTLSVDANPDGLHNAYKRMALNGSALFQYGPLDQGWWPDGLYTAPTDEALKYDIERTKAWGFNMIRKHIKVEPARWYYWCDVLGMLVWQDMPAIGDRDNRPYLDKEIHANLRNRWSSDSFIGGTDCTIPQQ